MEAMAGQGALVLSFAQEGPGGLAPNPLVLHATYVHGARVRALYSCSSRLQEEDPERRTLIGQANRRLHWQDICWFKARGAEIYDFGGWYSGTEDAQRLAINRFKECYGGQRVTEYEAMVGVSLLGKSAVAVRRLLKGGG